MEVKKGTLIMFVGCPASGKSTLAKKLGFNTVSSDDIRLKLFGDESLQSKNDEVFAKFNRDVYESLEHGNTTIADSTALKSFARRNLYEVAKRAGAPVMIVVMNVPLKELIKNNKNRDRVVPEYRFASMFETLEREYENIYDEADEIGAEVVNVFL